MQNMAMMSNASMEIEAKAADTKIWRTSLAVFGMLTGEIVLHSTHTNG